MNHYLESLFSLKRENCGCHWRRERTWERYGHRLGRRGGRGCLVSRTEKELKETIEEIRSQGGKARAYPADVSKFDQIPSLVQAVYQDKGRIDILINNAGFIIRKMALDYTARTGSASWM